MIQYFSLTLLQLVYFEFMWHLYRIAFRIYRFCQSLFFLVTTPWFVVHSLFNSVNFNVGLLSLVVDAKILRILPVLTLPADCSPGSN